ncbi:MAG: alpha/beta fold hydrolase [Opitutaceae bacterium]|nr:alpha/beta fold hydrolase [Opitutaceae bacterium]
MALAACVVGFAAVSVYFAYDFTGPARRLSAARAEQFLPEFEAVRFPARDGVNLGGWFVPCPGAKQAVVILHGHGSTRAQGLARAGLLREHGFAVLLYDARGHGTSAGELVSFGWFETRDLHGALDWLRARGFAEFGCIGMSQGGATIALAAAELRDVRWAVLESVYPTLPNAIDRRFRRTLGVPGWLAGSLMVPIAEHRLGVTAAQISPRTGIAKLACPVLVMSGELDRQTLPADAREVFDAAPGPKSWWIVPGAGHVDLHGFAKRDYETRLLAFLAERR